MDHKHVQVVAKIKQVKLEKTKADTFQKTQT